MFRAPRPALSLLLGLVVVVASACSAAATTAPGGGGGTSGAPTSAASGAPTAMASGAPTAAASAANPNDPNSIITAAISGGEKIKSFHIDIEVSGTIKAAALKAEAGSAGAGITSDIKLDGTSLTGDVDVANQAAHLTFTVPPMAMLGNVPLTGDLILKNSILYYKVSLLGTKYTKMDLASLGGSLGALSSSLPVAVPTAAASTLNITDEINQLRAEMNQAGVKVTLVGVEQIGGQDANHLNISFPLATLNAEIAAAAPSTGPVPTIDSASLDVWIYKANAQLAKIELKGASSTLGNLDVVVTITNYDAPVTIKAPAASEISPAS